MTGGPGGAPGSELRSEPGGGLVTGHVHDVERIDSLDTARYGGKAAGLARMTALGLRVPPAFVVDTEMCRAYRDSGQLPEHLMDDVRTSIRRLEAVSGKVFAGNGSALPPLLVSVRSGAQISMPGMMDTVLNLGLDAGSVTALAEATADPAFAVDTWLRFWCMYADTVLDVDPALLREQVEPIAEALKTGLDDAGAARLEQAITGFLREEGCEVSTDPWQQLGATVEAVFSSWDSRRAKAYRAHHGIDDDLGTAVTVQAMVFGNLGSPSGSGVAFTRDPSTGRASLYGEYLDGGQGEEVVAGTATPTSVDRASGDWATLIDELREHGATMEREYRDALDIEFTVEQGALYLLQVRPAKRTAGAAVAIAVALVDEGLITPGEAVDRVAVEQVELLVSPVFDAAALDRARSERRLLATGIPASPGHASGRASLDPDRATAAAATGTPTVLIRPTTSPQDLAGMLASEGILTARGGATSHAAVVSRALNKACVVGCGDLVVDPQTGTFAFGDRAFAEGDELSIDGATGEIFAGIIERSLPAQGAKMLDRLLAWADERSGAEVWLNARQGADFEVLTAGRGGIGPVGITDLLVEHGRIQGLLEAIEAYSNDEHAPAEVIEQVITRDVADVVRSLFERVPASIPVDLRMPRLMSARARRMVAQWASLTPHLLLPLGPLRIVGAVLAGIDEAARASDRQRVTVHLAGLTTAAEMRQFAALVAAHPAIGGAGAVLQNVAALTVVADIAPSARSLWIDVPEIIRSFHGYPEELLLIVSELTGQSESGRTKPGAHVLAIPALRALIEPAIAVAGPGCRVGVELQGVGDVDLATSLYETGFRNFSRSATQGQQLRLVLGQRSGREP